MTMTNTKLPTARLACALALAPLGACAEPEPPDLRNYGYTIDYECSRWRCGYNTSEINGKSLQELQLDGQPNGDGVELVGFLPPLGLLLGYELDVEGDALVARGGLSGNSVLRGYQLIGGTMLLRLDGGLVVPVVIAGYEQVDSWATDGAPVAAYSLVYTDLANPLLQRSVCKGTLLDPLQASVVILAGERYDLDEKTVIGEQDRWMTMACAGSAAAKMALLGYGPGADFDGQGAPASVEQRQATLKMITADYCGDGNAYTRDGTPLAWENQAGTAISEPGVQLDRAEAIWTEAGALCLDTPRFVDPSEVGCALPSCADFTLDDGEWATYVVEN